MAIQINGTTVIDNNRNLCNTQNVNTTTVCATTVCATTFGGAGVSGLGGEQYVCAISCTSLTAGDPVATCCTVAVGSMKGDPGFCAYCDALGCCNTGVGNSSDSVAVKFLCSDCCFATVTFLSPIAAGSSVTGSPGPTIQQDGFIRVNAFCVNSSGGLSSTSNVCFIPLPWCCICDGCLGGFTVFTRSTDCLRKKPIAVSSNSGSKATVLLCRYRCYYSCGGTLNADFCCFQTDELHLCMHTANNCITVICHCCVRSSTSPIAREHFITPDNCYFITISSCNSCQITCASMDWGINVKLKTDTDCYLSYPNATVICGCPFKSIFCSTCTEFGNECCFLGGEVVAPFTYGTDGWMPLWVNTFINIANPLCTCGEQRLFAWKPTGNNCNNNQVWMTCNVICPRASTGIECCIPFYYSPACFCLTTPTYSNTAVVRSWDQGDCVKRLMYAYTTSSATLGYRLLCFKVCSGANVCSNVCLLGFSDSGECCNTCLSCQHRFFYVPCYTSLGGAQGVAERRYGYGLSSGFYSSVIPLDVANSCWYFAGPTPGLYGCSDGGCNYWSGTGFFCGGYDSVVCTFKFRQALANTTPAAFNIVNFTNDCANLKPIQNVTATHSSVKSPYWCFACYCPKAYNYQPISLQGNNIIISATNGQIYPSGALCVGNERQNPYVIVHANVCTICNNLDCFLGISQNSVSAGEIACIAVPGMVDRSNVIARYFPTCSVLAAPICIGSGPSLPNQTAQTTTLLGIRTGGYNFCHYGNKFVTLKRYCDCRGGNLTMIDLAT